MTTPWSTFQRYHCSLFILYLHRSIIHRYSLSSSSSSSSSTTQHLQPSPSPKSIISQSNSRRCFPEKEPIYNDDPPASQTVSGYLEMSETLEHTHPNKTDGKDGIAISPAFVSGPNGPVDTEHHASVEPASSTPSPAEFVARIQAQQETIDPTDEVSPLLRTASGSLARAIPYNVVKQVGSQANVAGLLNPRLMSAIILQQYST